MKNKTTPILVCLLIGLCFLWTGSGYLTWMYHLLDFYPASSVDILTEIIGYLFQICGLLLVALYSKKRKKHPSTAYISSFIILADFLFITLSALSDIGLVALFFGYLMNLFHGLVAGIYLTRLVTQVSPQNRGIVFGLGYGLGSVCSWLISLIGNGNFLKCDYVLILYALLTFSSIFILHTLTQKQTNLTPLPSPTTPLGNSVILLAGITILVLSSIINMVFYFPIGDLTSGGISLEFSRAFYAISLITAGLINDKSRKWGAVICIAILGFPFALLVLQNIPESGFLLWIFSYLFWGFCSVYRVIVFADMAGRSRQFLYLAGIGLMFGRCGDVVGAFAGMQLKNHALILVLCICVAFMITIFLFINLYHKLYIPTNTTEKTSTEILEEFEKLYQFSPREIEVFKLVLVGRSNIEIAEELFISENTVKFHIKNLLKKTNCANRTALVALFKNEYPISESK